MDAGKRNRLKIDVDSLANKNVKRRKKRNLNETIFYEINGKNVPVFTPEFLEENRIVETELRQLRKLNNDFEEHNSVLVNYIQSLSTSCDQISNELTDLNEFRDSLRTQLAQLKAEVKGKYGLSLKVEAEPQ